MKRLLKKMIGQMTPFFLALIFVSAVASFSASHPLAGKIKYDQPAVAATGASTQVLTDSRTAATVQKNSSTSFDPIRSLQLQLLNSGK